MLGLNVTQCEKRSVTCLGGSDCCYECDHKAYCEDRCHDDGCRLKKLSKRLGILKEAKEQIKTGGKQMTFEWIRCSKKLPDTPKTYRDLKMYFVVGGEPEHRQYRITSYADGWNNFIQCDDGAVFREFEMHDIVAWAEIPEYTELEDLDEVIFKDDNVEDVTNPDIILDGLEVANV